jgi:hypothetical protein
LISAMLAVSRNIFMPLLQKTGFIIAEAFEFLKGSHSDP